tara:strand:- start:368 stop:496 length:129 start_codon:yes stop_codon:yes gene_type:complete
VGLDLSVETHTKGVLILLAMIDKYAAGPASEAQKIIIIYNYL